MTLRTFFSSTDGQGFQNTEWPAVLYSQQISQNRKILANLNYHMSIQKSQAILKCFIDLKSSVWFTLGSEDETMFCDTWNFFQPDCWSRFLKTLNGRQSYVRSKFHKIEKFQLILTITCHDPDQTSRFCGISISCFCLFVTIFCPKHGVTGDV